MDFTTYQHNANQTAIYNSAFAVMYPSLGLAGEVGEVCNKVKKLYRDKGGYVSPEDKQILKGELGDVLWYLSQLAWDLGIDLDSVAANNIAKLKSRQERNTLQGEGDNR